MRGFLMFCVLLAAVVVGVGLWRGWFIVDRERIKQDTNEAVDRIKKSTEPNRSSAESSDRQP
jgi:hypothetical protein